MEVRRGPGAARAGPEGMAAGLRGKRSGGQARCHRVSAEGAAHRRHVARLALAEDRDALGEVDGPGAVQDLGGQESGCALRRIEGCTTKDYRVLYAV